MSQLESKLCDSSPNFITFTTLCFYQILTCTPMIQALALLLAYYIVLLPNVYMYPNLNGEGEDYS
jgi:hypothetical protein